MLRRCRVRVSLMVPPPVVASDALLDLLLPLWQLVIGVLVLVTLVVSVHKLVMRGPSRMGGAMLMVGAVVVGVAVLSYLIQTY
jgi:Na+/H+-dicarboxylate symporter